MEEKLKITGKNILWVLLVLGFCFFGCEYLPEIEKNEIKEVEKSKPLWTFIIYMAGDNELSASALEDLNELEEAKAVSDKIQIFALVDFAGDGNLSSNSGTFLFKIKNDFEDSEDIVSERIACPPLRLRTDEEIEINLADSSVLEKTIDFIKGEYPSQEYGLIMWGHGTGYKSANIPEKTRGFAVDDTSGEYMSTIDFAKAINTKNLSVIGFDTCFGMLLENIYEIKDCGKYFIGSSGLVPANGWNYKTVFSEFAKNLEKSQESGEDFCKIAVNHFENLYSSNEKLKISYLELEQVRKISEKFDKLAKKIGENIVDKSSQEKFFNILFNDVKSYYNNYGATDLYLDLYSLADKMLQEGIEEATELKDVLLQNEKNLNIGIHFAALTSEGIIKERHSNSYIKNDKIINEQLRFVAENQYWVPNYETKDSVLDKLFYTNF